MAAFDPRLDRAGGIPLSAQLAARIRSAVADGGLGAGERLPSVRRLAAEAGVNVNTVRAVYARLEAEGLVRSEQGRGTFVAGGTGAPAADSADAATRRALRRQIAELEAALSRLPPPPAAAVADSQRRSGPALLSTDDLKAVRDELLQRLRDLDAQRRTVLEQLEQLEQQEPAVERTGQRRTAARTTPSLAGARVRWVGT